MLDLVSRLSTLPTDDILDTARHTIGGGRSAWLTLAACIGITQERARYGDRAVEQIARVIGLHRSRVARLGQIWRAILRGLLDLGHPPALIERAWYDTSLELASRRGEDPVRLYLAAENRRRDDPSWTCSAWRRESGLERITNDIADAIRVLVEAQTDDLIDATPADPAIACAARASAYAARIVERVAERYTVAGDIGVCLVDQSLRCFGMSAAGARIVEGSPDERPDIATIDDRTWLAIRPNGERLRTLDFPAPRAFAAGGVVHDRYHSTTFKLRPVLLDLTARPVSPDVVLCEFRVATIGATTA